MVNWEREPGERVEDFAAAYLLMRAGRGNQIRPAQGDRGIDVQIPTPEGWEIYQVKRFSTNLSTSAKQQIKESWERFSKEVVPTREIKSWSLVLPLEPTPQNETWFDELTSGVDFSVNWIGRALLDAWAADEPKLAAYFFGGGEDRLHELMAMALTGGSPPLGEGDPLLESIQSRMQTLSQALDEVDPFYRYELELRSGRIDDLSPEESIGLSNRSGLVHSTLEQVSDGQFLVTHVVARSAVSIELRPIKGTFNFEPSTPAEQDALERWMLYGAPLSNATATVIRTEGPPGTTLPESSTAAAWVILPVDDGRLPPLEIRLIDPAGQALLVLPVTHATRSSGVKGTGLWLRAEVGPAAAFEYFVGSAGRDDSVLVKTDTAAGATPAAVLPAVRLIGQLPGNSLELAIQGGQPIMPTFQFKENSVSAAAEQFSKFVEALSVLQQHTLSRVTIPRREDLTADDARDVLRKAALLRGHEITGTFSSSPVSNDDFFAEWNETERPLKIVTNITVKVGDTVHETDMQEHQYLESVWFDRSVTPPALRAGSSAAIRSVAVPREALGDDN